MTYLLLLFFSFGLGFGLVMAFFLRRESKSLFTRLGGKNKKEAPRGEKNRLYAAAGFLGGMALGCLNNPITALIMGLAGFFLAPGAVHRQKRHSFIKAFNRQYPGAVAALAACAGVGAYVDGFGHVAREYADPVAVVFGYIHRAIESGMPPERAIEKAIANYGLPVMGQLADSYRLIGEIGAGEKAGEALEAAAEQSREQERYEELIRSNTSEIRASGVFACALPLLLFILLALPQDSPQRYVLLQDRTPLFIALGVMGAGWLYVRSVINKVSNT